MQSPLRRCPLAQLLLPNISWRQGLHEALPRTCRVELGLAGRGAGGKKKALGTADSNNGRCVPGLLIPSEVLSGLTEGPQHSEVIYQRHDVTDQEVTRGLGKPRSRDSSTGSLAPEPRLRALSVLPRWLPPPWSPPFSRCSSGKEDDRPRSALVLFTGPLLGAGSNHRTSPCLSPPTLSGGMGFGK